MDFFKKLWNAEPIVTSAGGALGIWFAIPPVLEAFGHPLTDAQTKAIGGLITAIAVVVARSKAVAPDTHAQAIALANRQPT